MLRSLIEGVKERMRAPIVVNAPILKGEPGPQGRDGPPGVEVVLMEFLGAGWGKPWFLRIHGRGTFVAKGNGQFETKVTIFAESLPGLKWWPDHLHRQIYGESSFRDAFAAQIFAFDLWTKKLHELNEILKERGYYTDEGPEVFLFGVSKKAEVAPPWPVPAPEPAPEPKRPLKK